MNELGDQVPEEYKTPGIKVGHEEYPLSWYTESRSTNIVFAVRSTYGISRYCHVGAVSHPPPARSFKPSDVGDTLSDTSTSLGGHSSRCSRFATRIPRMVTIPRAAALGHCSGSRLHQFEHEVHQPEIHQKSPRNFK
jgi:hypothetical protein